MMNRISRRSFGKLLTGTGATLLTGSSLLSLAGCSSKSSRSSSGGRKIVIGYWGGTTCDATMLAAYEFGLFDKQGLDCELALIDYNSYPAKTSKGTLDTVTLSPDCFKQLEQGVPLALVNGSHTGCCSFVVPKGSNITSVKDLKGKRIGVEAIGGASQMLMSVKLGLNGLDFKNDVTWKVYAYNALEPALIKGEVDCFGYWDPICRQAIDNGNADLLFRMSSEETFMQYACCYQGIATKVIENEPDIARSLYKGFIGGVQLCRENPKEVAEVLVNKGYVGESVEFTTRCLEDYIFWDNPVDAERSYKWYLGIMKDVNILDDATNIEELFKRSFIRVDQI